MEVDPQIIQRLEALEERNRRVDGDKAWETSIARRIAIMILTYLVVVCYLSFVVHINPWINGFVPVLGYLLSTLTLSVLKKRWLSNR